MKLVFILHGEDVAVDAAPDEELAAACRRVLAAHGAGELSRWELRDAHGTYVDVRTRAADVAGRLPLYLSFPVGTGA
ncbi:MAG: DUF2604 domain-containing protein [Polyangiales bacterium]